MFKKIKAFCISLFSKQKPDVTNHPDQPVTIKITMNYVKYGLLILSLSAVMYQMFLPFTYTGKAQKIYDTHAMIVTEQQEALALAQSELCTAEKALAQAKIRDAANNRYTFGEGESFSQLEEKTKQECINPLVSSNNENKTPLTPSDLFYVFAKTEGAYISQNIKEHFKRNGYLATDIATGGRKLSMYAPSYDYMSDDGVKDEARKYTAKIVKNEGTMGLTIELHWKENGVPMNWAIGHLHEVRIVDGQTVSTGEEIGVSGGCPNELMLQEVSTGCHVHIELRKDGTPIPYPEYMYTLHGEDLKKKREIVKDLNQTIYSKYGKTKELAAFLEAIHWRESNKCISDCKVSPVGASGGMQFMPRTFRAYKCGETHDVNNIDHSMCAAEKLVSSILKDKTKDEPDLPLKWRLWKVACHYNAGYKYNCTHAEAPAGVVSYSDQVIERWENLMRQ